MKRRSFLLGTATGGVIGVAGCLGTRIEAGASAERDREPDPVDGPIDGTVETGPSNDGTDIDPDADYVVRGPEGYFSAKGPWNTDLDGVVIHGYDLVAYYEEERPVEGAGEFEYEYDGVTFRFAREENREAFASEPEAYVPAFGGYCSLGVGNGYKDGMHPEAFDVLDGTLYFNLTPRIHEGWLRNYEARIQTAEENWPTIKHSTDPLHIGPGL